MRLWLILMGLLFQVLSTGCGLLAGGLGLVESTKSVPSPSPSPLPSPLATPTIIVTASTPGPGGSSTPIPRKILPDPTALTLKKWEPLKIKVLVQDTAGQTWGFNPQKIQWSSEDITIADVRSDGTVSGEGAGSTNILIRIKDISTKVPVTVVEEPATGPDPATEVRELSIRSPQIKLAVGKTHLLDASVILADGNANRDIIWSSEDESIVTVDENGNARRINPGPAQIFLIARKDSRKTGTIQILDEDNTTPGTPVGETGCRDSDFIIPAPGFVQVNNITETAAVLNWERVGEATYKIYLNDKEIITTPDLNHTLTNLAPNTAYQVQVVAVSRSEESCPATTRFSTPAAEGVPKNLRADSISDTRFTLTWEGVPGASLYKIYKEDEILGESAATTYQASSLSSGVIYRVRVSALVNGQESSPSPELEVSLKLAAPSGLAARDITPDRFVLDWSAVQGASSYKVYKDGVAIAENLSTTSYPFTSLSPEQRYQVSVASVNSNGESRSAPLEVKTSSLDSVSGLSQNNVTASGFSLVWQLVSGATEYRVYRDGNLEKSGVTGSTVTLTGLNSGTQYQLQVTAVTGSIESAPATLAVQTLCLPPNQLRSSNLKPTRFDLSWDSVSGATGYNVYRDGTVVANNVPTTTYSVTGLAANTTYSLTISAINQSGESSRSAPLSVSTPPDVTAPPAPVLSFTNLTQTSVTLTWNSVTSATRYKVYQDGSPIAANITTTSYNVTGLSQGTQYKMEVQAVNSVGESPKSFVNITTKAPDTLDPVTPNGTCPSGNVSSQGYKRYQFEATAGTLYTVKVTANSGDPDLYIGASSSVSASNSNYKGESSGSENQSFTPSASGTQYIAVYGYSASSYNLCVTYSQTPTAPEAPSVSVTNITANSITVSWPAVSGATSYKVYRDGATVASNLTSLSYTLTGLNSGTTYQIEVSAVNTGGETKAPLQSVPTKLAAPIPSGSGNAESLVISWSSVSGADSYKIYTDGSVSASNITSTSYTFTNLSANHSYRFEVTAVNSAGESASAGNLTVDLPCRSGLLKGSDSEIYAVSNCQKRHYVNPVALICDNYNLSDYKQVPQEEISSYSSGSDIYPATYSLKKESSSSTVYLVVENSRLYGQFRRAFISEGVFFNYGFSFSQVQTVSNGSLNSYPVGKMIDN